MDERLDAGRHHLTQADSALDRGDWDESRRGFLSALLQFRGPELKIGEGHALRGLASVELGVGDTPAAESALRDAVKAYRDVRTMLDTLDDTGASADIRADAMEGEAAAQVLLGELLLRTGRVGEAQQARDWARAAFDAVGHRPSEAGLQALTGRLAVREGDYDQARQAYSRALATHEESGDKRGQAVVLRASAEVSRLSSEHAEAEASLKRALALSRELGDDGMVARTLAGLGSVARQTGDVASARLAYEEVLTLAQQVGDREMEGFADLNLGELRSRTGDSDPVVHLRQAAAVLGSMSIHHGVGAAMHHGSQHALNIGQFRLALALAEGTRRLWRGMDPVRGVGQALRLQVKALAGLQDWRAVLAVAHARAMLVGKGNSIEVRDFYRAKSPPIWLEEVDAYTPVQLFSDAEWRVSQALTPVLKEIGLSVQELGSTRGCLALLDALHTWSDAEHQGLPEVGGTDLEALPPEQEFYVIVDDADGAMSAIPSGTPEE